MAKVTDQEFNRDSFDATHLKSGIRQRRPTGSTAVGTLPQLQRKRKMVGLKWMFARSLFAEDVITCTEEPIQNYEEEESSARFANTKSTDKIPFLFKNWYSLNRFVLK